MFSFPGYEFGVPALTSCSSYGAANLCSAAGTKAAMQDVACTGEELSLTECTWSIPSQACSSHEKDSILYCGPSAGFSEGSVRLLSVDGAPSLTGQGIVEVFMKGEWSRVCGLSAGAQTLACKALGFAGAVASEGNADAVRDTQAPRVGGLDCKGSEASLLDCSFEFGEDVYCAPSESSMVHCT